MPCGPRANHASRHEALRSGAGCHLRSPAGAYSCEGALPCPLDGGHGMRGRIAQVYCILGLVLVPACGGSSGTGSPGEPAHGGALTSLVPSVGVLSPAFDPAVTTYSVEASILAASAALTATAADGDSTITVAGVSTDSGARSHAVPLAISGDTIAIGAWLEDSGAAGVGGDQGDNSVVDSGAVYILR